MRQSQAALAVFVRDLLVTNVARAANLTLLRRDAVLATRPALDQRTRDRVRLSAFLPDKLFGPQADEALEEQARNPTTVLRRPVSTSEPETRWLLQTRRQQEVGPSQLRQFW